MQGTLSVIQGTLDVIQETLDEPAVGEVVGLLVIVGEDVVGEVVGLLVEGEYVGAAVVGDKVGDEVVGLRVLVRDEVGPAVIVVDESSFFSVNMRRVGAIIITLIWAACNSGRQSCCSHLTVLPPPSSL
jgi:hypothetical protein